MSGTKEKPSSAQQDPAEGSRQTVEHELERNQQRAPADGHRKHGSDEADRSETPAEGVPERRER